MDDEQKPDPLLLGLTNHKKAKNEATKMLTRSTNWSNKGSISIKKEAWPSSNEATKLRDLAEATKDWVPTKPPKKSYQEPEMVPLLLLPNEKKLLPKPNEIPTRPRSELKRKARSNQQPESPSPSMKKTAENLGCQVCEISCSSRVTLQQHLMGRPHKAKLLYRQLKRGCNGDAKGKPRCDVCKIWCSDRDGLNMHFKGQKHKAKLKELQLCNNNGGQRVSKSPIMCQLCNVPCMNEDLFNMHLKGKQHITKVELKRRGLVL